jgi:hypothetical protein
LLISLLFLGINSYMKNSSKSSLPDIWVGVDVAYDSVEGIKNVVDEVKSYTNFFAVGSTGITFNVTKLDEVCQYIYDSGLHFTIFTFPANLSFSQADWVSAARQKWGSRFLGLYVYDEPGGHQIDRYQPGNLSLMSVSEANNYTDAANKYVKKLKDLLTAFKITWHVEDFPLFISDYALYEFDYRVGYDTIFAEFGFNLSRPLQVALCRGAAAPRKKDWGVIITWTYDNPPYLESGQQLFDDMLLAYQNGAKYILVFDYPKGNGTYGILQQEHLGALKQFWQYIKNNCRTSDTIGDRVTYVLPKDYGYGFRGPNDKIWGLWEADNLSSVIWRNVNALLSQHIGKIDIIYEDNVENNSLEYAKLIFWNGTILVKEQLANG